MVLCYTYQYEERRTFHLYFLLLRNLQTTMTAKSAAVRTATSHITEVCCGQFVVSFVASETSYLRDEERQTGCTC